MNQRFQINNWDSLTASEHDLHEELGVRELMLESGTDDDVLDISQLEHSLSESGHPTSLYIPDGYEPGYPYPLLIWLHGANRSELEIQDIMPHINERNCFAIGVRGNVKLTRPYGVRYGWSLDDESAAQIAEMLREVVCNLRRVFHIHSERIFLGGNDAGATTALSVLLEQPDWFGGVAAISGELPKTKTPLTRFRSLQGKQVLIGSSHETHDGAQHIARLLHSAGMEVQQRTAARAAADQPEFLREINQWIMSGLGSTTVIS